MTWHQKGTAAISDVDAETQPSVMLTLKLAETQRMIPPTCSKCSIGSAENCKMQMPIPLSKNAIIALNLDTVPPFLKECN
jgi:hypothetical protein